MEVLHAETEKIKVLKNPENRKLPCMDYHIKKCSGPCTQEISVQNYQTEITALKKFLRGHTQPVLQNLQDRMMTLAQAQNFEAAAKVRDLIDSIKSSTQKQTVQFGDLVDRDFLHVFRNANKA